MPAFFLPAVAAKSARSTLARSRQYVERGVAGQSCARCDHLDRSGRRPCRKARGDLRVRDYAERRRRAVELHTGRAGKAITENDDRIPGSSTGLCSPDEWFQAEGKMKNSAATKWRTAVGTVRSVGRAAVGRVTVEASIGALHQRTHGICAIGGVEAVQAHQCPGRGQSEGGSSAVESAFIGGSVELAVGTKDQSALRTGAVVAVGYAAEPIDHAERAGGRNFEDRAPAAVSTLSASSGSAVDGPVGRDHQRSVGVVAVRASRHRAKGIEVFELARGGKPKDSSILGRPAFSGSIKAAVVGLHQTGERP